MFPSSGMQIVFLLGHLIKSYGLWTMSKIVAMFTATFIPTQVTRVLPQKRVVSEFKTANAAFISADCRAVPWQGSPSLDLHHNVVQIPPKHKMWFIQENDFDFSSGFSQAFRPLDVYDRSQLYDRSPVYSVWKYIIVKCSCVLCVLSYEIWQRPWDWFGNCY
jgi:hypothetical protein